MQKSTCAHLKLTGKYAFGFRTIKARNGKYYKSNAESIRSSEPLDYIQSIPELYQSAIYMYMSSISVLSMIKTENKIGDNL